MPPRYPQTDPTKLYGRSQAPSYARTDSHQSRNDNGGPGPNHRVLSDGTTIVNNEPLRPRPPPFRTVSLRYIQPNDRDYLMRRAGNGHENGVSSRRDRRRHVNHGPVGGRQAPDRPTTPVRDRRIDDVTRYTPTIQRLHDLHLQASRAPHAPSPYDPVRSRGRAATAPARLEPAAPPASWNGAQNRHPEDTVESDGDDTEDEDCMPDLAAVRRESRIHRREVDAGRAYRIDYNARARRMEVLDRVF